VGAPDPTHGRKLGAHRVGACEAGYHWRKDRIRTMVCRMRIGGFACPGSMWRVDLFSGLDPPDPLGLLQDIANSTFKMCLFHHSCRATPLLPIAIAVEFFDTFCCWSELCSFCRYFEQFCICYDPPAYTCKNK
jgi:hypothetical protein